LAQGAGHQAQGTRKLKAESKNRGQGQGWSRNGIRLMALGTRQTGIDVVNFLAKTTRQKTADKSATKRRINLKQNWVRSLAL